MIGSTDEMKTMTLTNYIFIIHIQDLSENKPTDEQFSNRMNLTLRNVTFVNKGFLNKFYKNTRLTPHTNTCGLS